MKRIISLVLILAIILCGVPLYAAVSAFADSSHNMVSNPSFENGLDDWKTYNGASSDFNISAVTEDSHDGAKSLHRYVGGSSSVYNQYFYSELHLNANTEYVLSFWVKGNPAWGRFFISNETEPKTLNCDDTSDKPLWFQWTGETYSDWTKLEYNFYTSDITDYNLYFYLSAAATNIYFDSFCIEESYRTNMIKNGSFSGGNSEWEFDESYFSVNQKKYLDAKVSDHKVISQEINFSGRYLKAGFSGWLNQYVTMTKGKRYNVSIDVYFPENLTSGFDLELKVCKKLTDIGSGKEMSIELSGFNYGVTGWQTLTASFIPTTAILSYGSSARVYLALSSSTANSQIYIDNVKCESLIQNGDFENKQSPVWKIGTELITEDYIGCGQNYKLSFRYKGTGFNSGMALWSLSTTKDFDILNTYLRGFITKDASDWQEASYVFNSGEHKTLNLLFQTLNNAYSLDNITLTPTSEAVTLQPISGRAYLKEEMSGSYYSKYKQPKSGRNIIANEDFVGTAKSKTNDALSFVSSSNNGTPAGTIVTNSNEAGASYLGNSSLKFSAGPEEERVTIPMSLDANTDYWLTLYIKADGYTSDENGWSRFSYGIADTSSGNFIRVEDITDRQQSSLVFADRIQCIPRFDGEWHYLGVKFTTNSQTDLSVMLRGRRITAYVDKLYVWKASTSYTEDFNTTLDKITPVTNIKSESTLLGMSSGGTNLISNSDFENSEEFWGQEYKRVGVYGNNLKIEDTRHNLQKNAFHYKNELLYPWNCYYIKWIDVKPNTNYTLSAKYSIVEPGEGFFGLIAGYKNIASISEQSENLLYPSNTMGVWPGASDEDMYISKWDFTQENQLENCEFKTVGVTFNSGGRNRVGFYVQDGGGEAYIDDIKLFETKYAVTITEQTNNFPNNFISKQANITVADGMIHGIPNNATLADIRSYFEYGNYIRFYDAFGNEISDLSVVANAGMEVRLMNGPSLKATAVIAEKNIIENAGFESDLNGWTIYKKESWMLSDFVSVSASEHRSGEKSLHYINGTGASIHNRCIYKKVTLQPNTNYNLSFYMKGTPAWGSFAVTSNFDLPYTFDNNVLKHQWGDEVFSDWTKQEYKFMTDDRTEYIISFYLSGPATDVYLDDFNLVEDKNIINNGGFENGLNGWVVDKGNSGKTVNVEIVTDEKHSGSASLNRWLTETTYNQTVYQNIKLKANAKYSLSFWIKGSPTYGRFFISDKTDNPIDRSSVLIDTQLTNYYGSWTKLEYTFTTTDKTDYIFCLLFQSKDVDVFFDDICIKLFETVADANEDGYTNSQDLTLLRKYLIGIKINVSDSMIFDLAKDNKVNVLDLVKLKKTLASLT